MKDNANGRSNTKTPSWLPHILPARNPEEQTLEVVVKAGQLHFRALRDINSGEELRAWFGQDLADILKLPMIPPNTLDSKHWIYILLYAVLKLNFMKKYMFRVYNVYKCIQSNLGV